MTTAQAREVVAASQRLMDGLLTVEDECFAQLNTGLQRTSQATRERIMAAWQLGPSRLRRAELLPEDRWLAQVLLPPISQLVALARERAVAITEYQMRHLVGLVGEHATPAGQSGVLAVRTSAPDVERVVYSSASDALERAAMLAREVVAEQRRIWAARNEDVPALVARLCSAEQVGLPGAGKGAVWSMQARLHATARAASVDTCNALLLTGMRGWNDHPSTEPA